MTKVLAGHEAPKFSLNGAGGKPFSLDEALKKGPVLAAFFKISCPVCQFTFPFLERLYKTYGSDRLSIVAVSQNDARDTKDFCAEYGITFPAVLEEDGYPVSNQYGLTNVPTILLISPEGKVAVSSLGFSKADLEKINSELARAAGRAPTPLFRPDEDIPEYKPG